uniref:RRM domain-containing protein n=1 Tax=Quercus lobata TaxID=97700 RepID=A0A7N2MLY9_QUELO
MVVGSASADDCAVKPLTSLVAKWGKRLFTRCISIEATVDNVQLYFSQFGYVLDVYLAKDERKKCHRGFGFVTISDEISTEYTSQKVHRIRRPIYVNMIYDR